MSPFWGFAALLAFVAVAFIIPPLLGRSIHSGARIGMGPGRERINAAIYRERLAELEQEFAHPGRSTEEFDAAKADILRNLADETRVPDAGPRAAGATARPISAVVIAATLPLAALLGYLALGQPSIFLGAPESATSAEHRGPGPAPAREASNSSLPPIQSMVANLEQRLGNEPSNVEGWILLSRSYSEMENIQRARGALDRGLMANPGNPSLLVAQAEIIGRIQGNQLTGEPLALIYDALRRSPEHRKGLWLAGIGELQSDNPAKALELWERLRASGPMEDEDSRLLARFVAQAQTQMNAASGPLEAPPATDLAAAPEPGAIPNASGDGPGLSAPPSAGISVRVALSDELASTASSDDTVFVFARAAKGPRMPLAIERRTVSELPITVHLDDSMAMMPTLKLSSFADIVVGARVSKSGNAMPTSGDLFGEVGPITHAEQPEVVINIDKTVP